MGSLSLPDSGRVYFDADALIYSVEKINPDMSQVPSLIKINRAELEAARRMSPEERFLAGFRLLEAECKCLREEIRREAPEADEQEVHNILEACLDIIHDKVGREYVLSLGILP